MALRTATGQRLLAEVAERGTDPATLLATVTELRRRYPAPLVADAVTQLRLRQRGRAKLGPVADQLFFTPDGLEQATRGVVAEYRARRFATAAAADAAVLDLCCGIGGDLIALGRAGLRVRGVDRDPVTVAVATANVDVLGLSDRAEVRLGDARDHPRRGWWGVFCDPARRADGRRTFDPDDYSPPFDFLTRLGAEVPATAAKVAPGIDHSLVPAGVEAEWISVDGAVKEAALWWPALATTGRRATLLPGGATLTATGVAASPGPVGRYLYEPDGAVIRAGLVAEVAALLDARLLDPTIAYLTTDHAAQTPFATGYEITDVVPFSVKRLRALLAARGVGVVTVKKRGTAVTPEQLRRQLRLSGSAEATVILTRVAGAQTALLARPLRRP